MNRKLCDKVFITLEDMLDDPLNFFLQRLWSYFTYKDIIQLSMIKNNSRLKCSIYNQKYPVPISLNNNSKLINDIDFNYSDMFTNILKLFPVVNVLTMIPNKIDLAYNFSKSFASYYKNPHFQDHLTDLTARYNDDVDLMGIDKLVNLKYLHISRSKGISGLDSAHYFRKMKNLNYVNLSQCMNVIDDLVIAIVCSESSSKIIHLGLFECRRVSNLSLYNFQNLKQLQFLNIGNCPLINDQSIEFLQTLITLTDLNISNCYQITDVGLNFLKLLTNLEILDIQNLYHISDIGADHLSSLVRLKYLDITKCQNLTDNGLQFLASLTNLEDLYMSDLNIIGDGLLNLCNSNKIKILFLSHCDSLKSFELGDLTSKTDIEFLELSNCYSLSNLSSLTFLARLRYLSLGNCHNILKNEFIKISSLMNLITLKLSKCQISNDTMMNLLLNNPCLDDLELDDCENIDDNTLHYISLYSTKLSSLSLTGCSITDNGLVYLKSLLPQIKRLDISACNKITLNGIINFKSSNNFNSSNNNFYYDDCELISERDKRSIKRKYTV